MRYGLFVLLGVAALPVAAIGSTPTVGKITGNHVHLRAGPDMKYPILARLDKGALVEIVGARGVWEEVVLPGGFACYVHSTLVEQHDDGTAQVKGSRVHLRASAGTDLLPLELLVKRGRRLTVLGTKGEWTEVLAPEDAHLFVYSKLVEDVGSLAAHRGEIERAAKIRRKALLSGKSPKVVAAVHQGDLRNEVVSLGRKVMAGEGDAKTLAKRLKEICSDVDDELTRGYARSLLAIVSLREKSEGLTRELRSVRDKKTKEAAAVAKRLADARSAYRAALAQVKQLEKGSRRPFRAMGVMRRDAKGFYLADGARVVCRLSSHELNLRVYLGQRVGVDGHVSVTDPSSHVTLLVVDRVEIVAGDGAKGPPDKTGR